MDTLGYSEQFIKEVCDCFGLQGEYRYYEVVHSGHINSTYRVYYFRNGEIKDYILQKVNTYVFQDPVAVMERLKDRIRVIHLKDGFKGGKGIPLGQGEAPVQAVIEYAAANGITMVVESETLTPSGMDEAIACIDFLKANG
jgi:hypothetical protein